ncbi:unnamed protein product [Brachionus calyciflorus]|uniref:Uncharacterized protein n=1 Tax=Brachionus calyciflorus TaxID=104777 RepID=A0A813YCE2_9BILA|nr:unnamed protein product [Brachionus calyciflorus]
MKGSTKVAKISPFKERLYVLIGCIPMITVMAISLFLVYEDYALNNFTYFGKSWHMSNVEKTTYDSNVPCVDSDYLADRSKYPSCASKQCFRYFTDFLITQNEGTILLKLAKKGWALGDDNDSVSNLNIETGFVNRGDSSVKIDKDLITKEELDTYENVKEKILNHVKTKFNIKDVYLTNQNIFSKYTSQESKSTKLEYWHTQVDKYVQEWTQYSVVLFLNDYMSEFYGGRYFLHNTDNKTVVTIQPKLARLLVYSPGSENKQHFERLVYGNSYLLRIPLTCN